MLPSLDPRRRMVRRQIAGRGIGDLRVLAAMEKVPREAFLPEAMREFAYEDTPLPIEEGQTISQPYIVARMADAAHLGAADRVLEIGAGSGYAAAVLAELAGQVFTIERHPALAELARTRLKQLGYNNVEVRIADGTRGWPEQAPFDAIIATAGGPHIPDSLRTQLALGGRLVVPVGPTRSAQVLVRVTRTGPETWHQEEIENVRFVPLIGEEGWSEEEAREPAPGPTPPGLPQLIRAAQHALPDLADPEFGSLFDRYGDRRVVPWARRAMARRNSIALGRRSLDVSSSDTASASSPPRPTGPTAPASTAMYGTARPSQGSSPPSAAFQAGCGATPMSKPSSNGFAPTTRRKRWSGAPPSSASTATMVKPCSRISRSVMRARAR